MYMNVTDAGKTITLAFALVGLHLHLDHGLTGRGVPRATWRWSGAGKPPLFVPLSEPRVP